MLRPRRDVEIGVEVRTYIHIFDTVSGDVDEWRTRRVECDVHIGVRVLFCQFREEFPETELVEVTAELIHSL